MAAFPYECMTARYGRHLDDPRAGRRYEGHYAQILAEQGTLARVAVYPPGRSQAPGATPVTLWIDLACAGHCDAGPAASPPSAPVAHPSTAHCSSSAARVLSRRTDRSRRTLGERGGS